MTRRFRSIGIALVLACALCSAQVIPCGAPALLNDGWQIEAKPAAAVFDVHKLCAVLREVVGADINVHSLLVVQHGRLIAEVYRAGRDERVRDLFRTTCTFDTSTLHNIRSISKSMASLLRGITQGQGKTPSLDTPMPSSFPTLAELNRDGRETITFSQILSMSSGLVWNEWRARSLFNNDEFGLFRYSFQAHYVFDRPMTAPADTQFNYNSGNTAVLVLLLAERVDMPVPEYARQRLFEPLGIIDWEWVDDYHGRPLAFAGVCLRPRDLACIGQLVLQHGQWNGRQLAPAEWVAGSTRPHIDTGIGLQYGYQWWLGKVVTDGTEYTWIGGIGNGGQRPWIVPGLGIVAIATAGDYNQCAIWEQTETLFSEVTAVA